MHYMYKSLSMSEQYQFKIYIVDPIPARLYTTLERSVIMSIIQYNNKIIEQHLYGSILFCMHDWKYYIQAKHKTTCTYNGKYTSWY